MVLLSPSSLFPILLNLSLVTFTFLLDLSGSSPVTAATGSGRYLKLQLLHRNPNQSPSEALSSDTHRVSSLFAALNHRRTAKFPLASGASTGSGQYFVDLTLGNPPQRFQLVADTGSDLVWVTCSACHECGHRAKGSAFLARHSHSFSPHHCFDPACRLVPRPERVRCNRTRLHSPCRYEYSYADGSESSGFFSRETTSFNTSSGKVVSYRGLSFGCGFEVSGPSVTGPSFNGAQGVLGLGRGPISLPSQLGRRFGNKFSYCLMDYTIARPPMSYLMIGGEENDIVPNKTRFVYTPLMLNPLSPTFYYIGVETVSVGGSKIRVAPSVWAIDELGNGGTVVDSGTTLTFLSGPAYRLVLAAFKRLVKLPKPSEPTIGFDLCVNVSGVSKLSLPRLSFGLGGHSVFAPPPQNYFIDTAENVKCLALQPVSTPGGFSVFGNLMQQGFLFEFDKDRSRLGFSRHGCARP